MAKLKSLLRKIFKSAKGEDAKNKFKNTCYSQCGEDIIVGHLFGILKINNPSYVDIGCHHPYHLSNTAHFYESGFRGVCIEPDPALFTEIKKVRSQDTCLRYRKHESPFLT